MPAKLKSKYKKYFYIVATICLLSPTVSSFAAPETAKASGNVYNFGDIQFTENIQVSSSPNGPWTNENFIRVGQDADMYVKTTITLAGLKDRNGAAPTSLTLKQDQIYFDGLTTFNKTITGVGPSFVSKVDPAYVKQYADSHNGQAPAVPCYRESVASTGKIVGTVVIIGGAAALTAFTGGLAGAGAAALIGSGSSIAGLELAALGVATYGTAAGGAIGAAGGAAGVSQSSWINGNTNSYIKCDGPVRPTPITSNSTFQVGSVVFDQVVPVSKSNYANLGMSQIASDQNATAVNEFYVVPDTYFSVWNGLRADDFSSSIGAGKSVYVQLYATQGEATKHANDPRPNGVPANGSNTGSGQNVGGGDPLVGFINKFIGIIAGFLSEFIYLVFYWLIAPIIQAMLSIHTYTDTFAAVIYPGWEIIRNICNILFIVAIIAIGLGTLFRLESYQYKHLLVQLIIAALLINFSLVIAQAILGVADTIQSQFLPNNVEVIRSLARDLMVSYRSSFYSIPIGDFTSQGFFANAVQPLFFLTLSLGSFLLFSAIAIFLTIRIVALWILLMLSPIAYAAGVLPATEEFRKKWWSEFLKYAFFTPIMAFFLNLSAIISATYKTNPLLQSIQTGGTTIGNSDIATFVFSVGSNVLLLVFLAGAIQIASDFGTFGASAVADFVKKGTLLPFGAVAGGAKLAGQGLGGVISRGYGKFTTKKMNEAQDKGNTTRAALWRGAQLLHPKVFKKAWEARSHEKDEDAFTQAFGDARDTLNRFMPTEWNRDKHTGKFHLGRKTYFGKVGQQQLIHIKEKEYENADLSEEEKVEAWDGSHHGEDVEGLERLMIKGRHEDGRAIYLGLKKKAKLIEQYTKQFLAEGKSVDEARAMAKNMPDVKNMVIEYDNVDDLDNLTAKLEHAGYSEEDIGRAVAHLDELSESDSKIRGMGNAVREFDDTFRAANNFNGYKKMQDVRGKAEMLEELKDAGIFEPVLPADKKTVTLPNGSTAEIITKLKYKSKDNAGNDKTYEITDFDSLQSVIAATNKEGLKESNQNLKYTLTGARKQGSAQKRIERGDSEKWAASLEPAAFQVQNDQGQFTRFTSYGKLMFKNLPSAVTATFRNTRRLQGRVLKVVGLYRDENGKIDPSSSAINYKVMAEALDTNEDATLAILEKADIDKESEIEALRDRLNATLQSMGSPKRVDKAAGTNKDKKYALKMV